MKVSADALLKDLHKLSVDELIGLQLFVQKFAFAPEVKQEVLAKIQKRALSLMDRLNKQPNILADFEAAEKLVRTFGEYNHERKLIYPVAHSLKIKIRKAKYYLEKNPELRFLSEMQTKNSDTKISLQRSEIKFSTAEQQTPLELPEMEASSAQTPTISFTGNMVFPEQQEDTPVVEPMIIAEPQEQTRVVAPSKSATSVWLKQKASALKAKTATLKEKSMLLKEKTAPMRAKISAGLKDVKQDLGEEMRRWQTIAGAAVILLSGMVIWGADHAQKQRNAEQKVRKAETSPKQGDEKTFNDFQKVQKQQAAKVDTAAIKSYLNGGRA